MLDCVSNPLAQGGKLGCESEGNLHLCVAYVADPSAVDGSSVLFDQKRAIDGYAAIRGLRIQGYAVDSGARSGETIAHGLRRLVYAARRGDVDAVVVEHVSRFAADYALALRIAAVLSVAGATVHEARGGPMIVARSVAKHFAITGFEAAGASSSGRAPIPARIRVLGTDLGR